MKFSPIHIILFVLSTCPILVNAQLQLERQVIGSFALNTSNADTVIQSTGGQIATRTRNNDVIYITEGFEQPIGNVPIQVNFTLEFNTCDGTFNATITSITGCADTTNSTILWNNTAAGIYTEGLPNFSTLYIEGPNGCVFQQNYIFANLDYTRLDCTLEFYHFISPNGDGHNDEWWIDHIENSSFINNKVSIFNRWGGKVWEVEGYNNTDKVFIGQNTQGEPLPDGTYYYEATISGQLYTGFIELKR